MLTLSVLGDALDKGRYEAVGLASTLLAAVPLYAPKLADILTHEVIPAYRHGHIRIFFDAGHIPVGFITWAYLSDDTESRIIGSLSPWLHLSEWAEGASLWIRMFVLPPRYRSEALTICLDELFPSSASFRRLVRRKGDLNVIELDRAFVQRLANRR